MRGGAGRGPSCPEGAGAARPRAGRAPAAARRGRHRGGDLLGAPPLRAQQAAARAATGADPLVVAAERPRGDALGARWGGRARGRNWGGPPCCGGARAGRPARRTPAPCRPTAHPRVKTPAGGHTVVTPWSNRGHTVVKPWSNRGQTVVKPWSNGSNRGRSVVTPAVKRRGTGHGGHGPTSRRWSNVEHTITRGTAHNGRGPRLEGVAARGGTGSGSRSGPSTPLSMKL